jgi:subtilisin family serine protease
LKIAPAGRCGSLALALVVVAGLCAPVGSVALAQDGAAPAQAEKKPVKSVMDLPRHTYKIEGKASEFLLTDAPFKAFVSEVRKNTEKTLAEYDITDKTTMKGMLGLLQAIAIFEGRTDDALAITPKLRELEDKEGVKLMTGEALAARIEAKAASSGDEAAYIEAFKQNLAKRIGALPWEKVREEVKQTRSTALIISRDLVLGQIQASLDPVVEQNEGEVSGDMVTGLIRMRVMLDHQLPLMPAMAEVYGDLIDKNEKKVAIEDKWTPNLVTLNSGDNAKPVVMAVWDSGVDTAIFAPKQQLWTNTKEVAGNGKDDDNNGFVDDVHGIAFDLRGNYTPELLHSVKEMKNDKSLVVKHTKGLMDLQAAVDSPEANALRQYMSTLKADQVEGFLEDLGLYGNYSHGTHVAGIAAEGNPFARVLAARITFDFKSIPQVTPSIEQAKKDAAAAEATIEYFKKAGVRVVNMSWGGSVKGIEGALEMKGVGESPEARAKLAREIFDIGKTSLENAMKNAPEILFVAAAGNSDNDNEFSEMIPSGLNVPNMVTVGAIDSSGKPTDFTTFGKNVVLYANGFEVDSYVPGGERMKFSGTSMASPNVANLAGKIVALNPKLSPTEIVEAMKRTGDPLEGYEGRIIVNPKRAVGVLRSAQ